MGRKRHRKDNDPKIKKEEIDMKDNNAIVVQEESERGILGKMKDALTSDTAIGIYKGAGLIAVGAAAAVGAMLLGGRGKDAVPERCPEMELEI